MKLLDVEIRSLGVGRLLTLILYKKFAFKLTHNIFSGSGSSSSKSNRILFLEKLQIKKADKRTLTGKRT